MSDKLKMTVSELIYALEKATVSGNVEQEVGSVEYDSRRVTDGSVFVAVPGYAVDGFAFVRDAVSRGATAIVSERDNEDNLAVTWVRTTNCRKALSDLAAKFYEYPGKALRICGVTGTNGKTTSAHLLKHVLESRGKRVGLVSSLVYDTGGELFAAERTTPESLDLQRLLYLMRKNRCQNVIMEVSSHALSLSRVENINFRVGLFTNLTRDHLDYYPDMHSYFEAKARLLDKLDGLYKYAVINLDVPEFRELFGRVKSGCLSYSLENSAADVYTTGHELSSEATIFDLVTPVGIHTVHFGLLGQFNLINALGVTAAALASGIDLETIIEGLESFTGAPGRFQRVNQGQPFVVIIDYAHTPDAISRMIDAARALCSGRVITLFGCGGDRDPGKRPLMAEAASQADLVILTTDNPRSEDPLQIIEQVKPGLSGEYRVSPDRRDAIRDALTSADTGDIVLLLGKGAESHEETAKGKRPFDDSAEVSRALTELGYEKQVVA
ncbi:MAG: UDP-N-acetylmuramoyl-L-alanyl-D-glutamate--2,6-diaminopimelate ligase [Candidatus Zixiibacteriota bacterium]